ncbi:MAG: hypothetical protein IT209_06125 [Armatimonadetes bacterium]|nr:hypothetical protein [Armatimonadota bacterium]
MKNRTLALLATAFVLITSVGVWAADTHPKTQNGRLDPQARHRAIGCLQKAADAAGVTPEQKAQIKQINDKFRADVKALRQSDLPQDQKRAKLRELRIAHREEIKKVLTTQQLTAIKKYMKENCPRTGDAARQGKKA